MIYEILTATSAAYVEADTLAEAVCNYTAALDDAGLTLEGPWAITEMPPTPEQAVADLLKRATT